MQTIRLPGPPVIERDGVAVRPPRGRKAWAVLTYVLLAGRQPSRRQLAELLFDRTEDPLGAVRWTLAELRRTLGLESVLGGDPVDSAFGADVDIDVRHVEQSDDGALLGLNGELLDGVTVPSSPAFESWLLVERHRLSAAIEARLHQAAVTLLASGRATEAVAFASRAVGRNPLDEGNHELLVRSLAVAGDRDAAQRQVALCEDVLRRSRAGAARPGRRSRRPEPDADHRRRDRAVPERRGGVRDVGQVSGAGRRRRRRLRRAAACARPRRRGRSPGGAPPRPAPPGSSRTAAAAAPSAR